MTMDNIKGFIETSFVDWPGRTCAVLFLARCNFRCPFCHNHPLFLEPNELTSYPLDQVIDQLRPLKKWLGGVCISGGEPTLDPELPQLLKILQKEGFALKIDTNGSRPEVLEILLDEGLLAMIAMDVKTVLIQEKYERCAGTRVDLERIRKSIELIKKSGLAHEFRMTILPGYHTKADVAAWAAELGEDSALKLQNYNPRSAMSPDLAGERGFSPEIFRAFEKIIKP